MFCKVCVWDSFPAMPAHSKGYLFSLKLTRRGQSQCAIWAFVVGGTWPCKSLRCLEHCSLGGVAQHLHRLTNRSTDELPGCSDFLDSSSHQSGCRLCGAIRKIPAQWVTFAVQGLTCRSLLALGCASHRWCFWWDAICAHESRKNPSIWSTKVLVMISPWSDKDIAFLWDF